MQVRYQAALRPDEAQDSNRRSARGGSPSAQYFQDRRNFRAQTGNIERCFGGMRSRFRSSLGVMLESLPCAADREAFLVQQFADPADQQDFMVLVVAAVAAPLDRAQLGEFLLPVAQHVRLDGAQLGYFTDGEIALGRNRREFTPCWAFQPGRLRPGT